MRTIEEASKLLLTYKEQLKRNDLSKLYVVTADSMTVNKNPKNGRYEISKQDLPYLFDETLAEWRRKKEASKNNLMKFRVVRYKKWLNNEISKLEGLVNAGNAAQGDTTMNIVDTMNEFEDENEEVITDHLESKTMTMKEDDTETYNISQITNKRCPIRSNNCLCCIFCKNIQISNHTCNVECSYTED